MCCISKQHYDSYPKTVLCYDGYDKAYKLRDESMK